MFEIKKHIDMTIKNIDSTKEFDRKGARYKKVAFEREIKKAIGEGKCEAEVSEICMHFNAMAGMDLIILTMLALEKEAWAEILLSRLKEIKTYEELGELVEESIGIAEFNNGKEGVRAARKLLVFLDSFSSLNKKYISINKS